MIIFIIIFSTLIDNNKNATEWLHGSPQEKVRREIRRLVKKEKKRGKKDKNNIKKSTKLKGSKGQIIQ